jgi:microcystin-dependent protein
MATITVTPMKTFVSGETVTPATLNQLAQSTVALTAGSIVAADIASNAVTTAKILDANVTTAKITNANVTTEKIANASVTTAKIADANVTLAKLVTAVQQALIPAGAVQAFAMNSVPSGWLSANGAAVSRSTYANLFSAIGTTHGAGDGSETFNVPDLRSLFIRGSGNQNVDGTFYSSTFAEKEQDGIRNHFHSFGYKSELGGGGGGKNQVGLDNAQVIANLGMQSGTNANETRPVNIALLYCIKF